MKGLPTAHNAFALLLMVVALLTGPAAAGKGSQPWTEEEINLPTGEAEPLRSFSKQIADWRERIYVFVLEDTEAGRCIGSSTIVAKQGRPGARYYWLKVTKEERRSTALGKRFVHTKLHLMSTDNGPTEVGGLILDPTYRHHPEKCGKPRRSKPAGR